MLLSVFFSFGYVRYPFLLPLQLRFFSALACFEVATTITCSGQFQCIGATTLDEYRKHIEKDPALERRFQPVKVPEPTVDETIEILRGLRERYEIHHKLRYTDEALIAAAKLSYQYIRSVNCE
jgi:ATP-dependent Clp protease ATP-binding subunit ClpA